MKKCVVCKRVLPLDQFGRRDSTKKGPTTPDGLERRCRECEYQSALRTELSARPGYAASFRVRPPPFGVRPDGTADAYRVTPYVRELLRRLRG